MSDTSISTKFSQDSENTPIQLSSDYYLDNFFTLLDDVAARYSDLLSPQEKAYRVLLHTIDRNAARLYVRLIVRLGPYFRADKLHYSEIEDIYSAIQILQKHELLQVNGDFPIEQILPCLTRAEIIQLAEDLFRVSSKIISTNIKTLNKSEQIIVLCEYGQTRLKTSLFKQYEFLLPQKLDMAKIYRLLFFGNLYQEMSEFILEDLGRLKFEKYTIHKQDRLFQNRQILAQSIELIDLKQTLQEAISAGNKAISARKKASRAENQSDLTIESQLSQNKQLITELLDKIIQLHATYPSIIRRQQKAIFCGARQLERLKQNDQALHYYRRSRCPPSRERQVRIMEKQQANQEALQLLQQIAAAPIDASEMEFVNRFRNKLHKKLDLPVQKNQRISHPEHQLTLLKNPSLTIEQQVLEDYIKCGWQGFFSENILWNGLFGLYFWDIIFSSSAGAFFNPYQRGPKDLFSIEFRVNRSQVIAERLADLEHNSNYKEKILHTYRQKFMTANWLVHWKYLSEQHLILALANTPVSHLKLIFNCMATHLGVSRSGFPDLFLVKTEQYQLIEVKGPGDQLQLSQKRWLKYFQEWQIPYQICKVSWQ